MPDTEQGRPRESFLFFSGEVGDSNLLLPYFIWLILSFGFFIALCILITMSYTIDNKTGKPQLEIPESFQRFLIYYLVINIITAFGLYSFRKSTRTLPLSRSEVSDTSVILFIFSLLFLLPSIFLTELFDKVLKLMGSKDVGEFKTKTVKEKLERALSKFKPSTSLDKGEYIKFLYSNNFSYKKSFDILGDKESVNNPVLLSSLLLLIILITPVLILAGEEKEINDDTYRENIAPGLAAVSGLVILAVYGTIQGGAIVPAYPTDDTALEPPADAAAA